MGTNVNMIYHRVYENISQLPDEMCYTIYINIHAGEKMGWRQAT